MNREAACLLSGRDDETVTGVGCRSLIQTRDKETSILMCRIAIASFLPNLSRLRLKVLPPEILMYLVCAVELTNKVLVICRFSIPPSG
jgi:hypothetical protein